MAMAPSHPTSRPPRSRSRVVCQRCHARKVKCDLALRLRTGDICTNCDKRDEICERREQPKLQKNRRRELSRIPVVPANNTLSPAQNSSEVNSPTSSIFDAAAVLGRASQIERLTTSPPVHSSPATPSQQGYIGEFTVFPILPPRSYEIHAMAGSPLKAIEARIQSSTGADQLPPKSMIEALSSIYFKYLYHRVPVVDRQQLTTACPSMLLQQSLCLAGSVLRHPRSRNGLAESERFYARAKALFYSNHEHDPLTILQSVCLLTLWTVTPASVVTIDSGWTWLGLAIRFAFQIGLHRESTYPQRASPGCARRIAWFLYVQDKLNTVCFGRPQMILSQDFDLRPPSVEDFEDPESKDALLFVLYTNLMTILAKLLPLQPRDLTKTPEQALSILLELKGWAGSLPVHLRIFNDSGTRRYDRGFYEVLTWYFTCIITFFHVHGRFFRPSVNSTITLIASSCIIRLYQEMDYRDDINYLMAISNWSMMVASLPQLNNLSSETNSNREPIPDSLSLEELDILLEILDQRTAKFPGSKAILEKVSRIKTMILSCGPSSIPLSNLTPPDLPDTAKDPWSPSWGNYVTIPSVHEIFPFPKELSPRMDLLSTMEAVEADEFLNGVFEHFTDWSFENFLNLEYFNSQTRIQQRLTTADCAPLENAISG
ncbi:hypothetical protein ACJ72_06239 [Emergomyces africanus]|uniref:Zn(2)-C6 fungal-type domain-containing protein n=1 Tax=Emergomyces africanus TaxID=1955775 RepID=A0A1B7NRL0_9EURO|nr:hypothetical protein ACJ72_06239 [Emergomyces africanus]